MVEDIEYQFGTPGAPVRSHDEVASDLLQAVGAFEPDAERADEFCDADDLPPQSDPPELEATIAFQEATNTKYHERIWALRDMQSLMSKQNTKVMMFLSDQMEEMRNICIELASAKREINELKDLRRSEHLKD